MSTPVSYSLTHNSTPQPKPSTHPHQSIHCVQWNSGRTTSPWHGSLELGHFLFSQSASCALLQEQGPSFKPPPGWKSFETGRSAVIVLNSISAIKDDSLCIDSNNFDCTAVTIFLPSCRPLSIISVYRCPNSPSEPFLSWLEEKLTAFPPTSRVIGGDFNVKSKSLGNPENSAGGQRLSEIIENIEFGACLNDGSVTRPGWVTSTVSPSAIDISLFVYDPQFPIFAHGWTTHDQGPSDHNRISFSVWTPQINSQQHHSQIRKLAAIRNPPDNAITKFAALFAFNHNNWPHCAEAFCDKFIRSIQTCAHRAGIIKQRPTQNLQNQPKRPFYWNAHCELLLKERRKASKNLKLNPNKSNHCNMEQIMQATEPSYSRCKI